MFYSTQYQSPLGHVTLASNEMSLVGLWIKGQKCEDPVSSEHFVNNENLPILIAAKKWLDDYFAGKKPTISGLSLAPIGGDFRQKVWKILMQIPYGETITYGDIAKEIAHLTGKAKMSAQAVGGAVGHNQISIIIPCHRVIGEGGNLTGYTGGIDKKIKLLQHEGVDMSKLFI